MMMFKFYKVIILIPIVYIHKKTVFSETTFTFSVAPHKKVGIDICRCADMTFKIILTYVRLLCIKPDF